MNSLDYVIIGGYLLGLLVMGYSFKDQGDKQDYFLGNRSLGWKALSLSVMATQLSAISFISAPAFVGLREGGGLQWLSYELGVPLAMILLLGVVLPSLYRHGVVSIYDFLESKFGLSTRIVISFVFQFSRAFATAIMIYAISIILQGTMGIAVWQAILLTGVITVLYSLQGGMKAVVYGDVIQMVIIVLGTIACVGFGLYHLGGMEGLTQHVDENRLTAINFSSFGFSSDAFGLLPMVFGGVVLYASYYGCDQTQAQRALASKDEADLRKMMIANGIVRFPITLLYCFSGLVVGTLAVKDSDFFAQIPSSSPDWMMPIFILNYLPHGVIGILVVAILAAAMSSLSSAINSLAAVTVEDYFRISNQQTTPDRYLRLARWTGLFWGVVTLVLSLYAGNIAPTIIEAINKVGSVFYGPILAVFVLAVLAKNTSGKAVNLGIFFGVGLNIVLWLGFPTIFWFWWNAFGFVTTVTMALVFGRLFPKHHVDDSAKSLTVHSILTWKDSLLLIAIFLTILGLSIWLPSLLK